MQTRQGMRLAAVLSATVLSSAACDGLLRVRNPTVIDASTIDPAADAATFASSALNDLYDAVDNLIVYGAWFTGEAWVGDTFPTRNDIAKRKIDFTNGTVNSEVYSPIALAISASEKVLSLLRDVPDAGRNLNIARAALASGYAIELEAETFCQVVISQGLDQLGAPLSPADGSAEAVKRFQQAITVGGAAGGAEGTRIVNAARVGLARAYLQMGRNAEALAAAQQVPASFVYTAPRVDDPSNRGPLGNTVYSFTLARPSLVVPPYYRALSDPRVPFSLVLDAKGKAAKTQGNDLDFYAQTKYTSYGSGYRLASGLEARYIAAEAALKTGNPAPAAALVAERKVPTAKSGNLGDFVPAVTPLVELLDQKSRDFYLEGQHMGDWRRNPQATPYVLPAGAAYYAEAGAIGSQSCFPVPQAEVANNPNFPKG